MVSCVGFVRKLQDVRFPKRIAIKMVKSEVGLNVVFLSILIIVAQNKRG
jgi:hypothetical protein